MVGHLVFKQIDNQTGSLGWTVLFRKENLFSYHKMVKLSSWVIQ
jgi:hypothetical protein